MDRHGGGVADFEVVKKVKDVKVEVYEYNRQESSRGGSAIFTGLRGAPPRRRG